MRRWARWWRRRSLRARLTAAAAVVIAAALTLAGTLLMLRLEAALVGAAEEAAWDRADVVAERIAEVGKGGTRPLVIDTAGEEIVHVLSVDGSVVANSVDAGPLVPFRSTSATAFTQEDVALPGEEDEPFRVVTRPVGAPGGQELFVQVAVPLDDAEESVQELAAALTVGVPAIVVVLALLTWTLTGRALRPVDSLRTQAANIPGTVLDRRLEVPESADELARLAQTFNALLSRVEDAVQRQRRFIADAAHEIRSPVASLRTQLEVAQRLGDVHALRELLPGQVEDVRRLSVLVDDLLRLARLDADAPLRSQPVDLDDVILDAVRHVRGGSRVVIGTSAVSAARVLGDPDALERVVVNLLDNALRYAHHQVDVGMTADSHTARLTVTDDGPGIPPDRREEVFERFTRLDDARTRESGGTGLGLAIVREVVSRHGGRVCVADAHPGARLVVELPLHS